MGVGLGAALGVLVVGMVLLATLAPGSGHLRALPLFWPFMAGIVVAGAFLGVVQATQSVSMRTAEAGLGSLPKGEAPVYWERLDTRATRQGAVTVYADRIVLAFSTANGRGRGWDANTVIPLARVRDWRMLPDGQVTHRMAFGTIFTFSYAGAALRLDDGKVAYVPTRQPAQLERVLSNVLPSRLVERGHGP